MNDRHKKYERRQEPGHIEPPKARLAPKPRRKVRDGDNLEVAGDSGGRRIQFEATKPKAATRTQ
jgi:hypothetical protein